MSSINVYQLEFGDNFPEGSGKFSSKETVFGSGGVDLRFSVLIIQIIKHYFPSIT